MSPLTGNLTGRFRTGRPKKCFMRFEAIMKRSEINSLLAEGAGFFQSMGFHLPPFARFSIPDWRKIRNDAGEIFDLRLGWDVTDFGFGRYPEIGLLLFTIRNGKIGPSHLKTYAEKIMLIRTNQITPLHFHHSKTEDIINRGGGSLVFTFYRADASDRLSPEPVEIVTDGIRRTVKAGEKVAFAPGESVTLPPRLYHAFHAEGSPVMAGEVSSVNDDRGDNRFFEPVGRFPVIEEDEEPRFLLSNEYFNFL
jgi:D-lyxose ketol-isomerase